MKCLCFCVNFILVIVKVDIFSLVDLVKFKLRVRYLICLCLVEFYVDLIVFRFVLLLRFKILRFISFLLRRMMN